MTRRTRPQLGQVVALPMATIGVLSAILVWEVEHVGSIALAALLAAIGALVGGIIVVRRVRRDIDALSDHYESLLRAADEASRRADVANRLKDEFLSTLSHELRTPLNSVLGWARLLASGRLDPARTRQAIEAIERAGWAQSRLIEDLLDISRIVRGTLEIATRPTLVQPLVESAVASLRPAAEGKRISIALNLDPAIGLIEADPDRLRQVIWNLVSNAVKFTHSGGRVEIRLTREGSDLCLEVRDTGVGFDEDVAEHLFERFRQGDSSSTRRFGGLGLGLGIVRHLVELHGGTVTARSPGENLGSVFEVRLPLRAASLSTDRAPVSEPPLLDHLSVLVVDDDPQSLEFARATLEQYGAEVVTAASAQDARDQLLRKVPHVLVSDLRMPGEDGLQLIRSVRQHPNPRVRETPAVALTALARSDDRRRSLLAGFQMHVAKPIDPFELASTVERLAHEVGHDGRADGTTG